MAKLLIRFRLVPFRSISRPQTLVLAFPRGRRDVQGQCVVPTFAKTTVMLCINDVRDQCTAWCGDGATGSCRDLLTWIALLSMRTTADIRSSNGCAHHSGCGTLVGVPLRAAIPDLDRSLLVTCFLRVRYGIIGVALIAVAMTLAACGSDPTPTPTPTPGAWVGRSTPTRTPTPTPGPLVGMADFTVDESTTGAS